MEGHSSVSTASDRKTDSAKKLLLDKTWAVEEFDGRGTTTGRGIQTAQYVSGFMTKPANDILTNMTTLPGSKTEFVVCINNEGYPASLELHKIYRVLADEDAATAGDIRVIDESGEDYLYSASYFAPIKVPPAVQELLLKAS